MDRNQGLVADPLFVGMTRPPMVGGVTYSAMMLNVVVTTESFIVTKDLAWLLAFLPLHGLLYLLCPGGTGEEQVSHWVSTVEFAYGPPSKDDKIRSLNPLGFRVVEYRREPEAAADEAAARGDGR